LPLVRRLALLSALVLTAACEPPPPAAPAGPPLYSDPEGRFTARMVGAVETSSSTENLPQGGVVATTIVSTKDDAHLLIITALKLTGLAAGYDCEKGLTGMRDNTLQNLGCTASSDAPLQVAGHTARDVKFECTKTPTRGLLRMICDDSKLAASHEARAYSVMANYKTEAWNEAEATSFVAGFTLK
jgi:hypothetical protein